MNDEELHKAWVDACMNVAHDFAEEYCNMQCDGTRSHLEAATAHRTKLRDTLWNVPASMAMTDPELRAGVTLQRKEIDRLKEQLRDEGDRIAELKCAIEAMRVAGGSVEFQVAFDRAKALIVTPNGKGEQPAANEPNEG